jgi:hypothetical protein
MPAAAVVPPSVPASLAVMVPVSVSAKLEVPGDSMTGSADTSAGMPLGPNPSEVTAPSAWLAGTPTGVSMPAFGSCSTRTSLASPQVLPVSASRLDRPTLQAGYCSVIPSVSVNTSKKTSSHAAIANGDCTIRCHRRGLPSGGG